MPHRSRATAALRLYVYVVKNCGDPLQTTPRSVRPRRVTAAQGCPFKEGRRAGSPSGDNIHPKDSEREPKRL